MNKSSDFIKLFVKISPHCERFLDHKITLPQLRSKLIQITSGNRENEDTSNHSYPEHDSIRSIGSMTNSRLGTKKSSRKIGISITSEKSNPSIDNSLKNIYQGKLPSDSFKNSFLKNKSIDEKSQHIDLAKLNQSNSFSNRMPRTVDIPNGAKNSISTRIGHILHQLNSQAKQRD